ncbi:hypothetical protein [Bradyrhizobium sp. Ash2021]|uniref:hypothetical protein n=1 Tax=Bradyrhizobium sp. Ash2021 TaxID=2954771 RepID=UPI002814D05C|nr:hypothetical protein [Bradyrhizobium sp. Ash2021]WMT78837.1 hypothetical protein NL528_21925 [Bradyrhizobium sp. Ash2021]
MTNLARPGGNLTGFWSFEPDMGRKWLSVLKETAANMRRVGVLFGSDTPIDLAMMRSAEAVARALGITIAGVTPDTTPQGRPLPPEGSRGWVLPIYSMPGSRNIDPRSSKGTRIFARLFFRSVLRALPLFYFFLEPLPSPLIALTVRRTSAPEPSE